MGQYFSPLMSTYRANYKNVLEIKKTCFYTITTKMEKKVG